MLSHETRSRDADAASPEGNTGSTAHSADLKAPRPPQRTAGARTAAATIPG